MKQSEFSSNISETIFVNYFTLIHLIWKQRKENCFGHYQKDHQEKSVNLILKMKVIKHSLHLIQFCSLRYSRLITRKISENQKENRRLWSMQSKSKLKILFQVHKNQKRFNKWMKKKKKENKNKKWVKEHKILNLSHFNNNLTLNWLLKF